VSKPDWQKLGATIQDRREALGLTITAASLSARVSVSTWRNVESGANPKVTAPTLTKMAGALRIDPRELLVLAGRSSPNHRSPTRMTEPVRDALIRLLGTDPDLQDSGRQALITVYDALTSRDS
jgi:transcriptional regulator with XRE-family HTH domain